MNLPHLFFKLELGDWFIMLGRSIEEEAEVKEAGPPAHNDQPLVEYASRPGFRLTGGGGDFSTEI